MFENYKEMSAEEKNAVKSAHKEIRAHVKTRHGNLAWGFVRGLPYKRIERKTRTQVMEDGKVVVHNLPEGYYITYLIARSIPGFAEFTEGRPWQTKVHPDVKAWLEDPSGAIPAPIRKKIPYVPAAGAA
jgi:hypothetical protein